MHITRGFAFGLVGALLIGVFVAAAQASARGEFDDSPMTIPVGAIGDELTYASFEKGRNSPSTVVSKVPALHGRVPPPTGVKGSASVPAPAPSTEWSEPILVGAKVQEVREALDRTGDTRTVVLVATNRTGPGGTTVIDYVDVETRQRVRADWKQGTSTGTLQSVTSSFAVANPRLRGLEFQGQTLRLGDDVSHVYQIPEWMLGENWQHSITSKVQSRAIVAGHDAYGIQTEISLVEQVEPIPGVEPYRVEFAEIMYVSSDVAYPILSHRSFTWINGSFLQTYQELDSLHEVKGGIAPIPWSAGPGRAYRDENPTVERSGAQRHPADGPGTKLEYPLSRAVADVEADPLLLRFQLWRDNHPGYELIGARLERTKVADQDGMRWTLSFAVPTTQPTAESMMLLVVDWLPARPAETRRVTQTPTTAPVFVLTDLPSNSITVSAAEIVWSALANDDYAIQRVNRLEWGAGVTTNNAVKNFAVMRIGYSGPIAGRASEASSLLTIDVRTGNVDRLNEYRVPFDCRCYTVTLSLGSARVPVDEKRVFSGIQPPTVEDAAVTTSSALALFLALYFLPLLKFLGGQGLLLVPGYAKLRKEDILGNKVREHILQHIKADPGIHASDLARKVEAGWGTIVYHLSVLEKNKLVSSLVDGRHKRFFPIGVVDFSRRGQLAILKNETSKNIFRMIAEDPGVIQGEIASRAGLSVPATIWHLRRLEDVGLVGRDKQGRKVHYFANKDEDIPVPYDERDAVEIV
ncbi:MAG: winged helix-turn-helix transcriptional regulator [Euryarchaeota archaeon]|nr:winged helix-turn-helix transcriptional regulator [Euryarchaeota archaeon]